MNYPLVGYYQLNSYNLTKFVYSYDYLYKKNVLDQFYLFRPTRSQSLTSSLISSFSCTDWPFRSNTRFWNILSIIIIQINSWPFKCIKWLDNILLSNLHKNFFKYFARFVERIFKFIKSIWILLVECPLEFVFIVILILFGPAFY